MFQPGDGDGPPRFQTVPREDVRAQRQAGWFVLGDEQAAPPPPPPRPRFNGLRFFSGTTGE